jgi:spore coat-associated protein N
MRSTTTKILLSLAALGAVSVAAIGGTYANFAATPTTLSSNAFTAGSLSMSRSGSGAIFSIGAAKIGDDTTGSVTITNTGTLAGAYTLSGSTTGSSALASQLHLTVYKDTDNSAGAKIYDSALSGFSSLDLGTFAASGGAHTYYFHVSLPSTGSDAGDNVLQGLSTTTSFTWSAVQA